MWAFFSIFDVLRRHFHSWKNWPSGEMLNLQSILPLEATLNNQKGAYFSFLARSPRGLQKSNCLQTFSWKTPLNLLPWGWLLFKRKCLPNFHVLGQKNVNNSEYFGILHCKGALDPLLPPTLLLGTWIYFSDTLTTLKSSVHHLWVILVLPFYNLSHFSSTSDTFTLLTANTYYVYPYST